MILEAKDLNRLHPLAVFQFECPLGREPGPAED
jgi:hypothetical protein